MPLRTHERWCNKLQPTNFNFGITLFNANKIYLFISPFHHLHNLSYYKKNHNHRGNAIVRHSYHAISTVREEGFCSPLYHNCEGGAGVVLSPSQQGAADLSWCCISLYQELLGRGWCCRSFYHNCEGKAGGRATVLCTTMS